MLSTPRTKAFKDSVETFGKKGHLVRVVEPLTVFKKVWINGRNGRQQAIAVLQLPVGTIIRHASHALNYKMRADKAKVLEIYKQADKAPVKKAFSGRQSGFFYHHGKIARPNNGFDMHDSECSAGIHFWLHITAAREWR